MRVEVSAVFREPPQRRGLLWPLAVAAALSTGCTTVGVRGAPGGAPAANAPPSATVAVAPAPSPGSPPAFEQVSRGAERQDGLLPVWRKQDKVWLELKPEMLGKPLFLSPKVSRGIGEAGVFGGLMHSRSAQVGRPQWVEFRKVQQQVQLLAVNAAYTAQQGTPQALAVAAAYSPSLLASAPLASAPHAENGAVLVDLNALMLGDVLGLAQHLQRQYRQGYALDPRHTVLLQARSDATATVFEVSQHFATAGISAGSTTPGTPGSTVPGTVPDPRSLFVNVHYTLSPLPAQPMPRRPADARVGYFSSSVVDFTQDLRRTPRERFINRWRLDKEDPAAPLSEPVQPIVFWLDPSIPQAYRAAVTEGVLEWNKAFEAIGLRKAIEVRTPPADTPFDTLETGRASIRWMANNEPSFGAIGPSHVDPRSGEILDADIALESLSSRAIRTARSQYLSGLPALQGPSSHTGHSHPDGEQCQHAEHAAEQLGLALDVLATRGELDPDSPEVEAFVLAYLKDTTMHEVGHALGLRHNFRASRWRTADELAHPTLGARAGNSASVMDYAPINLPLPGQPRPAPFQTTLGPYDFWAIEYGYKPLPADPTQAAAALRAIAARSAEPAWREALAFGTDEDNLLGLDPQALTFDLGRDPVVFARQRLAIVRDLFDRQARRSPQPGDDAALPRRAVAYGLRELSRTSQILLRQVGGLVTRRDDPASGRDLLVPLPAAEQRAALTLLLDELLAPGAVSLPPALLRRLAPDYLDRQDQRDLTPQLTDFSVAEQELTRQRLLLDGLMAESLAERLLDNADKVRDQERRPLTVAELHQRLRDAVWAPPRHPVDAAQRRNLQREHVNRLAQAVVRGNRRADVRAVVRDEARRLASRLAATGGGDAIEAAHRRDCLDTLRSALQASVVRTTP
ncbi:hypothetical protein DEH84_10950 [Aquabacterium olei]|uniref:Metallopeptidase n=1 Tax=Aquabacterium olei TaxID=1296669 RepID=A0A2U8FSV4_9BURK|nr:hypothetical protein DEH84_10950 [Aquabacterium olei]